MTEEDKKSLLSEEFDGIMHNLPLDKVLTQLKIVGALHVSILYVQMSLPEDVKQSKEWKRLVQLFSYLWDAHGLTSAHNLIEATPEPFNPPF